MANTLLCYLQLCFSESVDCLANSIPLRGIRKYAELYSIWPKERFVALQSSRDGWGHPLKNLGWSCVAEDWALILGELAKYFVKLR